MEKAKNIDRVCHSSKDAETLALSENQDELTYLARKIVLLLFGDYKERLPIRIYTDSELMLRSITPIKQIERKSLRTTVQTLKERLINGDVKSYQWKPTKEI